jgi:hypothetical protein
MKPVGLTLKDIKHNPFTKKTSGELMLVHACLNCTKISCNRIAGDDNPHSLLSLLEGSFKAEGITLLTLEDKEQVLTALCGYNYPNI